MKKVVFLGLTTVDILSYVSRYPGSNEKKRADHQLVYAGGPAANAAVACAAMGSAVALITGLGDTVLAGLAREDLQQHHVSIIDAIDDRAQFPVLSAITIDESCGDRSVVYTNTATKSLRDVEAVDTVLHEAAILMLDGYYLPQAIRVAEMAESIGMPVVLDGGSWKDGIDQLLPFVDIAICSENFLPPACSNIDSVQAYLLRSGVSRIAVSRGGRSISAWDNSVNAEIDIKPIKVRDTLGAGDILHGAFCHYLLHHDFLTSLRLAAHIASLSCRYRVTREWIKHCYCEI